MKIAHIFIRFPHPYQRYNQILIERQRKFGIDSSSFFTYRNIQGWSILFWKTLDFVKGLFHFRFALQFRDISNQSLFKSIMFIGKNHFLIKNKYDLFHIHQVHILNSKYQALFKLLHIPCVVSLRGSDATVTPLRSDIDKKIFIKAINFVQGVHTVCEYLKIKTIQFGVPKEKIRTIRRTPEETQPVNRARIRYPSEQYILTTIGRFDWKKGFIFLLQSIRILLDRKINVHFVIGGDGSEEERDELLYWIDLLHLETYVSFMGFLSSSAIDELLAKTHIYIQPSISEGIPNTLIRAKVNRIPIVASAVGGIPEVVDENCGMLVPPGDPKAIASAVIKIVLDSDFRGKLYNGNSDVNFDPFMEMEAYYKFYSSVISDFRLENVR